MPIPELFVVKCIAVDFGPGDTVTAATVHVYLVSGTKEFSSICLSELAVVKSRCVPCEVFKYTR